MTTFVRFEAAEQNSRGSYPGVFALTNGLARAGILTESDFGWWRRSNHTAAGLYADPELSVPGCYDRIVNPGARSWFRKSSAGLIQFTQGYLDLLDRYDVAWVKLACHDPGRIVYEDDVQVVAVPALRSAAER